SITIGNLYAGRYAGTIARPPRTFVQQNVVINNITNNKTVVNNTTVVNNVKNVTMVAPLSKVDRTAVPTLKPVTAAEKTQAVQVAKDFRQASVQRVKLEGQTAVSKPIPTVGKPAQPLELPKTPVVNVKATPQTQTPPPLPAQTKEAPKSQPKDQPKDQ